MAFDALVLDLDGVICRPAYRFARYLEREHGLTSDHTRVFFTGPFLDCTRGQADLKEVIAPFLSQWGWSESVDRFLEIWFAEESSVDARLLEVVRQLRATGKRCYVATVQERYRTAYLRQEMGFAHLFDHLFTSAEVGAVKPQREFYAAVTQAIGLPPERLLFWDDALENVTAARSYGWQAEHYTGYEQFRALLKQRV